MLPSLLARTWNPGRTSVEFSDQWHNPTDVFSVLLILGGDVVARALAQLSGSPVTPVAFSFGLFQVLSVLLIYPWHFLIFRFLINDKSLQDGLLILSALLCLHLGRTSSCLLRIAPA